MADAANENDNNNAVIDSISLKNIAQGNMSMNLSALNSTAINSSSNERIEPANNSGMNASSEDRMLQPKSSNKTAFQIGSGLQVNESAFKTGVEAKPIKNTSKMWYLIQGVPHGYT